MVIKQMVRSDGLEGWGTESQVLPYTAYVDIYSEIKQMQKTWLLASNITNNSGAGTELLHSSV